MHSCQPASGLAGELAEQPVLDRWIAHYRTYYCADDSTFGYTWRWNDRMYTVDSKYYGGLRPARLRALISHMSYARCPPRAQ